MTKIIKMETTLNKQPRLLLSDRTRRIIVDLAIYLFVALFIYTAASKFMTFDSFTKVLGKSSLIGRYSILIAWTIPLIEIVLGALLIVPSTKKLGLYLSLALMIVFTGYLVYMILSGSKLPCHCGGVISSMSWKQHIWFNIGFIILAVTGLKLYKKE